MDLLVLTSSYPLRPDDSAAAAGLFVRQLCLELADQGHRVRVLTQDRSGPRADDPQLEVIRFPCRTQRPLSGLRLSKPRDLAAAAAIVTRGTWAADALVRRRRPDLVLAMWALPAGLTARWLALRHRLAYRVWALGSDIWQIGRSRPGRAVLRLVLGGAGHLFADGLALAEQTGAIARRPCDFLPSSRRLPLGRPRPEELAGPEKVFCFVGRFHPNKGADLLVDAAARLSSAERAGLRLVMFGDGPLKEQLRARIDAAGLADRVRLAGYAPAETVAAWLEHCHALVIPSRIESVPVILSDAAQAGCPVVATEVGDMGRLVERYGLGRVVAPDPGAIAEGLRWMVRRGRNEFAAGCRAMAADFSIAESARRLVG